MVISSAYNQSQISTIQSPSANCEIEVQKIRKYSTPRASFLYFWGSTWTLYDCINGITNGKVLGTQLSCLSFPSTGMLHASDSADVNTALMQLKSRGDPASTTALYPWPIEVTQACFTMNTWQLALQCTIFNWITRKFFQKGKSYLHPCKLQSAQNQPMSTSAWVDVPQNQYWIPLSERN